MSDVARSLEDESAALPVDAVSVRRSERVPMNVPADMVVYAAFLGREPEFDSSLADPLVVAANARRERPWSPLVLSLYLRQVYRSKGIDGLRDLAPPAMKISRPELAAWARRRMSLARLPLRRAG